MNPILTIFGCVALAAYTVNSVASVIYAVVDRRNNDNNRFQIKWDQVANSLLDKQDAGLTELQQTIEDQDSEIEQKKQEIYRKALHKHLASLPATELAELVRQSQENAA